MTMEIKKRTLALATFCERNGINMTKIAARLGMSRGLLHHHLRRTDSVDPAIKRRFLTQLKALARKISDYVAKVEGAK